MRIQHARLLAAGLFLVSFSSGCLTTKPQNDLFSAPQANAESDANSKLELPPKRASEACLAAAQLLERKGQCKEAAFEYEKARANDSSLNKTVCRRLAVLYDRVGDFDKASVEYEKALALHPKDAALLNDAGYSHYCHGDWTLAENYLRQAVQIKPDHKTAWINLGMTLVQKDRAAEAFEAFTHAVPEPEAHCNMAFAFTLQGKRREAIAGISPSVGTRSRPGSRPRRLGKTRKSERGQTATGAA